MIDIPFKDSDWVATPCVTGFQADTFYQQAGLIVYADDDNYLKWDYEADCRRTASNSGNALAYWASV